MNFPEDYTQRRKTFITDVWQGPKYVLDINTTLFRRI